jgi:hypothetical protein
VEQTARIVSQGCIKASKVLPFATNASRESFNHQRENLPATTAIKTHILVSSVRQNVLPAMLVKSPSPKAVAFATIVVSANSAMSQAKSANSAQSDTVEKKTIKNQQNVFYAKLE